MIYINGDSFTAGAGVREESGPESTWPYLLSKKMNLPIKEESRSGCSNYRIFRYALQEILSNHTLTHVVIMWTSYERQEFSIQGKNETFLPSSAIKTGQIYLKKDTYIKRCKFATFSKNIFVLFFIFLFDIHLAERQNCSSIGSYFVPTIEFAALKSFSHNTSS